MTCSQKILDFSRRAVASSNPNDLGRRPKEKGAVVEVTVLAHDCESVLRCVVPDTSIVRGFEPHTANMNERDAEIGKAVAESMREILIE